MDINGKYRPFYIAKLLEELTDEDHYLTTVQISNLLEERYGITSYRQTITKDMEILRTVGMDIDCIPSTQNRYRLLSRRFDDAELKLLIDAVASSKFISKKKSEVLAGKLASLSSSFRADELKRNISVESRVKSENELTLLIIDAINEAINKGKQIRFQYFHYNAHKRPEEKWKGYWYHTSPYRLIWNGDYYYVVCWNDKYGNISTFRIDRMLSRPEIMEEDVAPMPKRVNIDKLINTVFRMYAVNAERVPVELLCDNSIMDAMIDRFGKNVKTKAVDETHFLAVPSVPVNDVFFGWIFGFGGKVKIVSPETVKEKYAAMVKNAVETL
nr:WYL domain-containing protein [Lachnospiraceae bacterium]